MKGNFTRVPPGSNTEQLMLGWFAISHRWFNDKKSRRSAFGTIYRIKSKHGTIYRTIKFSPRLKGSEKKGDGQILLDWQGWINICDTVDENSEIEELDIRKANFLEIFYHSWSHPDPAYRHSMGLARIGIYISFISLILAFK